MNQNIQDNNEIQNENYNAAPSIMINQIETTQQKIEEQYQKPITGQNKSSINDQNQQPMNIQYKQSINNQNQQTMNNQYCRTPTCTVLQIHRDS